MPEGVDPCPPCGSREAASIGETPYRRIWDEYRRMFGVRFSDAVVSEHTPAPSASLHRCGCGLEYFSPLNPGTRKFYAELMAQYPYEATRWEFEVAANRIPPGSSIVDFGSGAGAFLELVKQRATRVTGVDLSATAIEGLRAKGIEARTEPFAVFAKREAGAFDVACAFQVLEHVPRVSDLLEPMIRVVRPGGKILISVPNRRRLHAQIIEPMDCPPHHMSRWSAAELRSLADRNGLELSGVVSEPPDQDAAKVALMRYLGERSGGPGRTPAGIQLRRGLTRICLGPRGYRVARRRGWFDRVGWFGHALLAEFRAPTA